MFGIDEQIAQLGEGGALLLVLAVALLLGLRHATDPDHLMAVSALLASERDRTRAHAASLGLSWGLGHATTLVVLGLPIVLFDEYLPAWFTSAAEVLVGAVIIVLAIRLLTHWRNDDHRHPRSMRSRSGAYGIGLIHGIGGSAGIGILLLASIPGRGEALAALLVFAAFTAVSMTVASMYLGSVLTGERAQRHRGEIVPALGVTGVLFGSWYALGAVQIVPYAF